MGRFLAYEVPLFAGFQEFMKGDKPYNKTILSLVKDERTVMRLMPILDKIIGGFSNPGTGIIFTLPVDWSAGLTRIDEEDAGESP